MQKVDSATNLTLRTIDTDTTIVMANNEPSPNNNAHSMPNRDRLSASPIKECETTEHIVTTALKDLKDEEKQLENDSSSSSKNDDVFVTEKKKKTKKTTKKNRFDDIRVFTFFMCLIVMLTNALVVGYRNSVITTIEKRYGFSSVFSGVLGGCLEFGSLVTTLFVSYFCAKSHIPRCIGIASLFCGIGALLYALPHLFSSYSTSSASSATATFVQSATTSGQQQHTTVLDDLLCKSPVMFSITGLKNGTQNAQKSQEPSGNQPAVAISSLFDTIVDLSSECLLKPSNLSHFIILIIANVLIGSSSAPLYTLGTSYIDNHVEKDNSSVYLAFIYSMLAFGPLVGYLVGAAFLRVYVHGFIEDLNIDPTSSNWIGAWYGGFVLFGILIFLTAFPFFCFPRIISKRHQPKQTEEEKKLREGEEAKNQETKSLDENTFGNFENLPKAMKRILSNRVFMLVTFGFCFEITIISGFMTFLPKYIEHQFSVDNSLANIYTGGIAIPGACFGIVAGGFIVKKLKINPKSASLMAIICNVICLTGIFILLFMGCDNTKMAGTTTSYFPNQKPTPINLTSECNAQCHCLTYSIEPICGTNGLTYFSPCHAGCKVSQKTNESNKVSYSSCSCIDGLGNGGGEAHSGVCKPAQECRTLLPFLIMLFFITLLTAINQMPMLMVTLRSVTEIERAFALGLQLVIMRILAYIPSPLIFGQAIDWTCVVWRRDECDKTGSCLFYDREKFRNIYGLIAAVYKAISLVLFVLLYISVRKFSFKSKPVDEIGPMIGSITSLNSAHKKEKRLKQKRRVLKRLLKFKSSENGDNNNKKSSINVTNETTNTNTNKMIVI